MNLRGVNFDKKSGKFTATISLNGYKLLLGCYDSHVEAADSYSEALDNRKNGAYKDYDDAYGRYIDEVNSLGVVKVATDKAEEMRIINNTSVSFYKWAVDNIELSSRLYKSDLFSSYVNDNPSAYGWLSNRRFSFWTDKYISLKGYVSQKGRDSVGRWIYVSK